MPREETDGNTPRETPGTTGFDANHDTPTENGAGRGPGRCADCGWPLAEPVRVASRHRTTEGVVVYARCVCGRLRVWVEPHGGAARRLVIGGTDAPIS